MWPFKKKLILVERTPPPRVLELIGWGRSTSDPFESWPIHRYTGPHYVPWNEDGSDCDGDFWTQRTDSSGGMDCMRGKPDVDFTWVEAPDPAVPITPTHILEALKRAGKITDEDIISAKTAVKLMGLSNP